VRYLDRGALWTHCTETRFWTRGADDEGFVDAQQHILHLIEVAGSEGLIAPEDIVKGLTPARLMEALPAELRTRILDATLAAGRDGSAFSDFELLEVVPVSELSEHLPLEVIWSEVVEPALAPGDRKAAKADAQTSASTAKPKPKAPKIEVVDKEKGSPYPITDDDSDLFDSDSLLDEIQLHEFEVDEVSEEITVS